MDNAACAGTVGRMWGIDPLWLGLGEIALGLAFCFIGQTAARVIIGLWGALVGFVMGNSLHQYLALSFPDIFSVIPWWVISLALALLVAWLAFAFYAVGVLVSMGTMGWNGGTWLAVGFGLHPSSAAILSVIAAVGLVMVGLLMNLPRLLLVLLTAAVGAGLIVAGLQQTLGYPLDWSDQLAWQRDTASYLIWAGAWVAIAGAGVVLQFRQKSDETLRDSYAHS